MFLRKKIYFIFFAIVLFNCASQKKIIPNISSLSNNNAQAIKKEALVKSDNNWRFFKTEKPKKMNSNFIKTFLGNLKNIIEFKKKPSVSFFSMNYFHFNDIYFKNIASFHTLVVHFPFFIFLLVLIFYFLFLFKKNIIYLKINFYLMLTSFLIVLLASFLFFPETENLKKNAEVVLKKHIYFAYVSVVFNFLLTIYFALKIWSKENFKNYLDKVWVNFLVIFFLIYSLFTIGITTFY